MKALILYRPNSEFARRAEEYARDFESSRGRAIEMVDVDSVKGVSMMTLYDIVDHPSLIVTRENGEVATFWQSISQFPLMNELAAYLAA